MAIAALPVTNGGSIPDGHSFILPVRCWNFLGAESGGCGTEKEQVWGLEALTSKRQMNHSEEREVGSSPGLLPHASGRDPSGLRSQRWWATFNTVGSLSVDSERIGRGRHRANLPDPLSLCKHRPFSECGLHLGSRVLLGK